MSEDLILLYAKIGLLEVLVRALLKNECAKHSDPAGTLEELYKRFKPKFEAQSEELNSESQSLVFLENFEMFFDQIRMDLQKAGMGPKS